MRAINLGAGIAAGPLFIGLGLVQAFTRDGFDLGRHPLSLLSLGDFGWIQIANFVATGVLLLLYAVGIRKELHTGPASTWGPRLVGAQGIGVIMAGVFVTDAGAGFPAGAPAGAPEQISWHGILHEVGFTVALVSWFSACFVLRRRFAASGQRAWARACIAAPVAVLVVAAWPDLDSLSVRLVIASAIQLGFLAALAAPLGGVVEDQSEGVADSGPDRADAVPYR